MADWAAYLLEKKGLVGADVYPSGQPILSSPDEAAIVHTIGGSWRRWSSFQTMAGLAGVITASRSRRRLSMVGRRKEKDVEAVGRRRGRAHEPILRRTTAGLRCAAIDFQVCA